MRIQARLKSCSGSRLSTIIGWSCLAALLLSSAWNLLRIVVVEDAARTGRFSAGTLPVLACAVLAIAITGLMSRTPVGLFATVLALSTTAAFLVIWTVVLFWSFFGAGSFEASRQHVGAAVTLGATLLCVVGAGLLVLDGRGVRRTETA
ncbi:MAG: hypothetical protein FD171_279 [Actinobacteria bacterium]|nr:MAG: hypothetical protein FD171_279 [Actinomycetota bacterium]